MNIANQLTIFRIACIPFFVVAMQYNQFSLAGVLFIIASMTDWLDGYLARKYHLITNFGKFADPLADKLLVITAFTLMIEKMAIPAWVIAVIICRELAVTGLRLLLVKDGEVLAAAWAGKLKTMTQMFAIIFLLFQDFQTQIPFGIVSLYICLALTIYSGWDYFYCNRHVFRDICE